MEIDSISIVGSDLAMQCTPGTTLEWNPQQKGRVTIAGTTSCDSEVAKRFREALSPGSGAKCDLLLQSDSQDDATATLKGFCCEEMELTLELIGDSGPCPDQRHLPEVHHATGFEIMGVAERLERPAT